MAEDNKGKIDGLFFNKPSEKAPEWVIGDLNIPDKNRFIAWLLEHPDDKIKIDLCKWTDGSYYTKLNTYKPSAEQQATPPAPPVKTVDDLEDDLPF